MLRAWTVVKSSTVLVSTCSRDWRLPGILKGMLKATLPERSMVVKTNDESLIVGGKWIFGD